MAMGPQGGYAMLAALAVTAIAMVFATTSVAAITARQALTEADSADARVAAELRRGLDEVCLELKRRPLATTGALYSAAEGDAGWQAEVASLASGRPGSPWRAVDVKLAARCGRAARRLSAQVELRPDAHAMGVCITGDVELKAPLSIRGSGLYCSGCLRGREWLVFGTGGEGSADAVRGATWPQAAAHVLGSIWARGREIHDGAAVSPDFLADTDTPSSQGRLSPRALSISRCCRPCRRSGMVVE
jgi:hypothetical protein